MSESNTESGCSIGELFTLFPCKQSLLCNNQVKMYDETHTFMSCLSGHNKLTNTL